MKKTTSVYLSVLKSLKSDDDVNFEWLVETTEQFCKDKAVYNAIVDGIKIIDGKGIRNGVLMLYLTFSLMPLLLVSITVLVMIIWLMQNLDLITTIL